MSTILKVAIAQFRAKLGDTEDNLNRCISYIDRAGSEGADIICFPELCHTGYGLEKDDAVRVSQKAGDIDFQEKLCACAARNHVYVIYSYIEKNDKEDLYIAAMLVNRNGQPAGIYRKCYLWGDYEKNIFSSDYHFPVFNTEYGKLGILICYDMEYPETARMLWKQGVDIIFVPMHFWTIDYMNKYAQAAAIYNTVPVIAVNGVADDKESCSKAFDECGNVLAECKAKEEDFVTCNVELGKESTQRRVHREDYKGIMA